MELPGASNLRTLARADIEALMRNGRVRFFVVERSGDPRPVADAEYLAFWRAEAHEKIADPARPYLSSASFPGGYCYRASEWSDGNGVPLVLLEASV